MTANERFRPPVTPLDPGLVERINASQSLSGSPSGDLLPASTPPEAASPFDGAFEQCQALENMLSASTEPRSDVVTFTEHQVGDQRYVLGRARQRDGEQQVSSVAYTLFQRQEGELGGVNDEPLLSISRAGDETLVLSPADIANGGGLDEDRERALQSGLEALQAYLAVAKDEHDRLNSKNQATRQRRWNIAIATASLAAVVGGGAGAGALIGNWMVNSHREDVVTYTAELHQARIARDSLEATLGEKCLLALQPYGEMQEFMGPRFVTTEDQAVDDIAATDVCGPTRIEDRQVVREYRETVYRVVWGEYRLQGAQEDLESTSVTGAAVLGGVGGLLFGGLVGGAMVVGAMGDDEKLRPRRQPEDEQ